MNKKQKIPNKQSKFALQNVMQRAFYIVALLFGVSVIICAIGLFGLMIYGIGGAIYYEVQEMTTSWREFGIAAIILVVAFGVIILIANSPNIVRWAWRGIRHGA